jgi:hypothetical protein
LISLQCQRSNEEIRALIAEENKRRDQYEEELLQIQQEYDDLVESLMVNLSRSPTSLMTMIMTSLYHYRRTSVINTPSFTAIKLILVVKELDRINLVLQLLLHSAQISPMKVLVVHRAEETLAVEYHRIHQQG